MKLTEFLEEEKHEADIIIYIEFMLQKNLGCTACLQVTHILCEGNNSGKNFKNEWKCLYLY